MIKKLLKGISAIALCATAFSANAQTWCTPSFNYPCGWGSGHMHIKSVSTTGGSTNISSNNTGCSSKSGYTYYSTRVHTGVQGTTVNFKLDNCPYYAQHYVMWVDFNRDGDFTDAGEEVYKGQITYGGTQSGNFTIPSGATPGNTRLRVRCIPTWYSAPGPCGGTYYGEAEDYLFVIVPSCSTKFDKPIDPYTFACANGEGSITVNPANGASYQWQVQSGGGFVDLANGGMYSDVDKQTLKLHNVPANMAGTKYRCMVTPTCGIAGRKESDTIALNIRPDVTIISQKLSDTACEGLNTILSYKASDPISSYQWQMQLPGGTYKDINPSTQFITTDDSLIITNLQDTLHGAKIRCIFSGICGTDTTKDIDLSVFPLPVVITDPVDVHTKAGTNVQFSVVATGVGVNYQWQAGVNGTFSFINENAIYYGVKTPVLTVNGIARAQDNYQFRCLISGTGSCKLMPDTSEFALLTVEPGVTVKNVINDNSITIFPSPAKGNEISLKADGSIAAMLATYVITDKTGKTITVGNITNTGTTNINISKLPADLYFIQVLNKNNEQVKSLKFTRL